MNLKGRVTIAAHPDVRLRANVGKMEFQAHGGATIALATQRIELEVGEIPLHLIIPFHKHGRVLAGSLGPFRLSVLPADCTVRVTDVHVTSTLGGREGMTAELHLQGDCKADIELAGEAPGKILKAAFEGVFEE